jgi:hypothetical protein
MTFSPVSMNMGTLTVAPQSSRAGLVAPGLPLFLDCFVLYSFLLSHSETVSWDTVFAPLLALLALWLAVFLHLLAFHSIAIYKLKVSHRVDIRFLFIIFSNFYSFFSFFFFYAKFLASAT